jgi:prevent-host-death family protein
MIKTLRESKAKLSELVDLASRGQDVLITVRGQVKARLTRAAAPSVRSDRTAWLRELRRLRGLQKSAPRQPTVDEILAQLREDRT